MDTKIQMVDLGRQYERLKPEIDAAMQSVMAACAFINGPEVGGFGGQLAEYLCVPHVVPCANGTDALQIALMALSLRPGDEVIVPAFTYVAAAEVVGLLGLVPVLVDVDPRTFTLDPMRIEAALTPRTAAIIAVHLFGQCADMEPILALAAKHGLYVVEDNAQSMGASYFFSDGSVRRAGTMGHIGTTSFFPSKPLACYGDGGAIFTSDAALADRLRKIANHGQARKYQHQLIGCNSRLDTLQAAVLAVKLRHLDAFNAARIAVARRYDAAFSLLAGLQIPYRAPFSSHIYHQYTVQVEAGRRDALQVCLKEKGIPSMVYYPFPLQAQEAFRGIARMAESPDVSARLCRSVLSLPIHTEMTAEEIHYIIDSVQDALASLGGLKTDENEQA